MKKLVFIISVIVSIVLVSCGSKKEEAAPVAGMMPVDLSSYGVPVVINVPDSTKGRLEIEDANGTIKIRVGKTFRLSIFEDIGDLALKKSDVSTAEPKKLKRYLVDEPTTIVYENEITEPEFHFYTIVKVGEKSFVMEDLDGEEIFSQASVETMLQSAKSIKLKEEAAS